MKKYFPLLYLIIIVLTVSYSYYSLMPHKVSDASTPLTKFSTERALKPLKEISKEAHYLGSKEHINVREFIVSEFEQLGLQVEIETQEIFSKNYNVGAKTSNIIAKIKGTDSTKALMLSTHYDSDTRSAIGTSDAGSGIVTIIEGIRAFLTTGKQPKNDIIILITDGEELGLLGATAYAQTHNIDEEVGMILVFESRGSGGPSYMLIETNGGNKNVIKEFQKAHPKYPVANSLMYTISKMLPNSTDLSAFREGTNINGMSFAFIGDHFDYHTPQDNFERMDRESLEHQGTYLMPLLHHFANADLNNLNSEEDYVYFNFPLFGVIYYPFSWVIPILTLVLLLFIGVIGYGIKMKKISTKKSLKGFIPFLIVLIGSSILTKFGWELLKIIHPQYNDIKQGFTYNGYTYIVAFVALTLAICFFVYNKYFEKNISENLVIAPIFIWLLISIGTAFYLKGGSYFILAVYSGLLNFIVLFFFKIKEENKLLLITLLSIPILIIFTPSIKMFPVGLGLDMLVAGIVILVLLFGILTPILSKLKIFKLDRVFFIIAIITFITASFQSSYTLDRKKPNSINYILNTNTNKAFWGSFDNTLDEFTSQFFAKNIEKNDKFYYKFYTETEVKPIVQPSIKINKDTIIDNKRFIDFSIKSHRNANKIELYAKNNFIIKSLKINGFNLEKQKEKDYVINTKKRKWIGEYNFAYKDSILNIQLSVLPNDKPIINLSEISYDLLKNPNFKIEPRKNYMMTNSYPNDVVDAIVLIKKIEF
ncbi:MULTISPECIES: M28 family peptidase [unclassified Tenacibaculum]|uniref:M28 family peptidase n=1 Tax=unclassified Tenacibaculum TaxID=2635139 RepID=UPI001F37B097|nr:MULTISPECIES: M28 family peptidase [unclassified Tenacibaculum]MCF2875240.1 M28 family peptidase [Tenacibaculum sp. Cn5-1]MCF2935316.1 M28 family peptidase [Tenacibaculum sp. Cn5-34]MCG7511242.1 M28 family peptidase [Tenacibaculum sp. Cn5-46]